MPVCELPKAFHWKVLVGLVLQAGIGAQLIQGAALSLLPEHLRPNPFGGIVAPDQTPGASPANAIHLVAARAGYASCHLMVSLPSGGPYTLTAIPIPGHSGIELSAYREWFHRMPGVHEFFPDALVPIRLPYKAQLPDVDNRIPGQTVQGFWLDIWVSKDTSPGKYRLTEMVQANGKTSAVTIRLRVVNAIIPDNDPVLIDHNSYGVSWFLEQYPQLAHKAGADFFESQSSYDLIHSYHRIFYEHRGVFHQLGYGHAGKVSPEFAPELGGTGKRKHVVDWTRFDRHYGPLLDGTAFSASHRGATPIPFVYLPINPEWPASFELWGEPGYEREFVDVVRQMENHFREKGWTRTNFEVFFNHKKRYKGFDWDGDEQRMPGDTPYLIEYARLMKLAIPAESPVHFVFRADVSWAMERQWKELNGVVNFWVCAGDMFSWYPYAADLLKKRRNIVWTYGGTPSVTEPSSHMTLDLLRAWVQQVNGFVRWQTTAPGPDPWFALENGTEVLAYPGDRFGIAGPIPSIRLKIERNAIQDIDLLNALAVGSDSNALRAGAVRSFNNTSLSEWWAARPHLADTNPEDWSNADIGDASPVNPKFVKQLDSAAWQRVRTFLYTQIGEPE